MKQLDLFDTFQAMVQDIRTDKQVTNSVSYDVGEKLGGSRKEIAAQRKAFLEEPTIEALSFIEGEDVAAAAELVNRDTFFGWFNFPYAKELGMEPQVAKIIRLLITRIDKMPRDNAKDRTEYTLSAIKVSALFKSVKTWSEYVRVQRRIQDYFRYAKRTPEKHAEMIENLKGKILLERNESTCTMMSRELKELEAAVDGVKEAQKIDMSSLGEKFKKFFYSYKSRQSTYNTVSAITSWEQLLPEKGTAKTKTKAKPVWKRGLPERPDRIGGKVLSIAKPEELKNMLDLRTVEFGHYVDDVSGRTHLHRAAEAFADLSDVLGVNPTVLSLGGNLSLAFGARGRGRALGHYEPKYRVINLTKERGSLGILAHEWFHALDHYLYDLSHDFKSGKLGLASSGQEVGDFLPLEIEQALNNLLSVIKAGNSPMDMDVTNRSSYRIHSSYKELYKEKNGDLFEVMSERISSFDRRAESRLAGYLYPDLKQQAELKLARQRKKYIKEEAEALAQFHEEMTGEVLEVIPYPSGNSKFYSTAIAMDRSNIGKYWSSNIELTARAFEAFVISKLEDRGWISDYLTCGIRGNVFPQGAELKDINIAFQQLIEVTKIYLK